MICSKSINCVEFAGTVRPDTSATEAKLIVTVTEDDVVLVIAILLIDTAMLLGAVYNVVLVVAAAPRYKVRDVSATIYIPFVTRIDVCKS